MHPDKISKIVRQGIREEFQKFDHGRRAVFSKVPIVFSLLVSVGAIATFSGLSKIITNIEWLNQNPWILLAFGISILVLTGSLYKKLS